MGTQWKIFKSPVIQFLQKLFKSADVSGLPQVLKHHQYGVYHHLTLGCWIWWADYRTYTFRWERIQYHVRCHPGYLALRPHFKDLGKVLQIIHWRWRIVQAFWIPSIQQLRLNIFQGAQYIVQSKRNYYNRLKKIKILHKRYRLALWEIIERYWWMQQN